MPRSQQVRSERYRPHDKIRVYLLEVRRTSRGPQIVVSRNHRNLLRRLLELEVPEIYNGQVDVKSIAREAGARSKVAVVALQEGVDPVGACVGMRGVRIQSIVRELNDEKIDVIEWDPDPKTFIAKALSPARVSQVHLDDHPDEGKTAIVIVPDDQLSLAIGREGQNARLAAKLTGWRIDIKSLTESASESLRNLDHPDADPRVAEDEELLEKAQHILAKKEAERPITAEDYLVLDRFVAGVEGRIIDELAATYDAMRKERAAAREQIPATAWELELEELDLPLSLHNRLLDYNISSVGDVLYRLELGDEALLRFEGIDEEALDTIRGRVADNEALWLEAEVEEEAPEEPVTTPEEAAVVADGEALAEETLAPADEEVAEAPVAEAEEALEEEIPELPAVEEQALDVEEAEVAEEEEAEEEVPAIDDLSTPLVEPKKPPEEKKKKGKVVIVSRPGGDRDEEGEEDEETAEQRKGRQLVFDEDAGRVVTKRKRKGGRRRPDWEDFEDMDIDELLEDEF